MKFVCCKKNQDIQHVRGFSLIELLLVVALLTVVGVVTFSVGSSFLAVQDSQEAVKNMHATLHLAHARALYQYNDNAHGIKIQNSTYTLFEGDSYASRDISKDEIFQFSSPIQFSGNDEIVYAKFTGIPSATGSTYIVTEHGTSTINVNEKGYIE